MEDLVKALDSFDKGAKKNLAASELLEMCKKLPELLEAMFRAEAAVKESLANIRDKAANVERKKELDELRGFGQSLEAVDGKVGGLEGIFDRKTREIAAVVRRFIGNVEGLWYRGEVDEEENATNKEAEGWRAQAQKYKPAALEVVTWRISRLRGSWED
ncbi:hypothetical protein B0T18DRAFT_389383 [Schizothecium vesticola]|uniref:Uncharacterized protein n=1 Tax=Schizothecium vesticola TaxID=314040 RepID=A0AA40K8F8_9PEZI|nr:hypothetical protein B0T18DRAFT_389383 [Schizothecium vesticola]